MPSRASPAKSPRLSSPGREEPGREARLERTRRRGIYNLRLCKSRTDGEYSAWSGRYKSDQAAGYVHRFLVSCLRQVFKGENGHCAGERADDNQPPKFGCRFLDHRFVVCDQRKVRRNDPRMIRLCRSEYTLTARSVPSCMRQKAVNSSAYRC